MTTYSGFVATAQRTTVYTWFWLTSGSLASRPKKGITIYNPISQDGLSIISAQMVFVPGPPTVGNGPFYMSLADLYARTGNNTTSATDARNSLQNASTLWRSSFDAWLEDGSPYTVSADAQPDPTPDTTKTYTTDSDLALMWSLIATRIKDACDQPFNCDARFWEPNPTSNTPYQIYIKTSAESSIDMVQQAVDTVLGSLDPDRNLYNVTVIDSIDNLGVNQIGHNFFNIYDTYMTDTEYARMLGSVYTDRSATDFDASTDPLPIRPWPDLATAGSADALLDRPGTTSNRFREKCSNTTITMARINRIAQKARDKPGRDQNILMNGTGAKDFAALFWPNAVYTNKRLVPPWAQEWLHRAGRGLGGQQKQKNICFGTSECNSHMLRSENMIRTFIKRTGWSGKLVTVANDDAHATGTRPMWQVDSDQGAHNGAPAFVQPPTAGRKPYVWAVAFLSYLFLCEDPMGDWHSFADEFDTFNRYAPLLFEAKLDEATLSAVLQVLAPARPLPAGVDQSFSMKQAAAALDALHLDDRPTNASASMTAAQLSAQLSRRLSNEMESSSLEYESTMDIFGSTISVDIYKYTGTIPDGVTPPTGSSALYEQAQLSTLTLSDLLPELTGSPFDSLSITNALFVYQNCQIDSTKAVGWTFDCDVTIGQDVGSIYSVAQNLFGTDDIALHLTAGLGNNASQTWSSVLSTPSFALTGTIDSLSSVAIANNVTLSTIGVHLHAIRCHFDASSEATLQYDWDVFGEMSITMPGSNSASTFDFTLSERDGYISLHGALQGETWTDAAGISGLDLESVTIDISFELDSKPSNFDVAIDAQLELKSSVIDVDGMLSGDELSLTATWASFELEDLGELFELLEGTTFNFPTVDVAVDTATLTISTTEGVSVTLNDVTIDGVYDIVEAAASIGPSGVEIRADYDSAIAICDSVTLKNVEIAMSLATGSQPSYLWFNGQVSWTVLTNTLIFDVQLYFSSGSNGSLEYLVYGTVTGTDSWNFGKLLKDGCPSVLKNVGLTSLSVLVASANITDTGPLSVPYKIKEGVQIYANVGDVTQVDGMLQSSSAVSSLSLYAHWPNPSFTIVLSSSFTSACVDLGHDIKTGPVTFTVATGTPSIAFFIEADLTYQPGSAGTALKFAFTVELGATSASALLDCTMNWNNPLGISSQLTITEVALGVEIDYAAFIATGLPNDVELKGKFQIGNTPSNEIILVFGDDVSDLLVKVDVNDIDINDIIRLASKILDTTLPTLPDGSIICKSFKLYACPDGAWLGSVWYPAGFSSSLDLGIFGVTAYASLQVDLSSGLYCSASIDDFSWGDDTLSVWVTDASLDVAWTSSDRHVNANGTAGVTVWGVTVSVSVWIKIDSSGTSWGINWIEVPSSAPTNHSAHVDIKTIFTFPVFGSYSLPLTMRKNVPPTDWQNPMSGGPGVFFTFTGKFDPLLLSHVSERVTHELKVMHSLSTTAAADTYGPFRDVLSTLNGGDGAVGPDDIVRWCNEVYTATQVSRRTRCEQLRVEYEQFAAKFERLVEERALAAKRHNAAIRAAELEKQALRQEEVEARAAAEGVRRATAAKLRAATANLVNHNRSLRRRIGDPAKELENITATIASVTSDATSVNRALQSVPTSNLPWNVSARRHLEYLLNGLLQRRSRLENARVLALQRLPELASNMADPMYERVRDAEVRIRDLQSEEESLSSAWTQEASRISTEMALTDSRLNFTRSQGDTLRELLNAEQTITAHVASRSPFLDEHGRLVNLEKLPESVSCEVAHRNLCLAIDAISGISSVEKTIGVVQSVDRQQRSHVVNVIDNHLVQFPTNLIQLQEVTLIGKLERSGDRLENLVLEATATGVIAGRRFQHQVDMPIVDHNAFVRGLVKKLLGDML